MKYRYAIYLLFFVLCNNTSLKAQNKTSFPLTSHDGHLYFTANICEQPVQIMFESGLPAFLIEEDFYEQHLKNSNIAFEPSKTKIRLFNELYDVLYRGNGRIAVGQAVYDGPIFILKDFDGFRIPIQYIQDAQTGKAVITIDLTNGIFCVGEASPPADSKWEKYKLSKNQMGMPTIKADLCLCTAEGDCRLKGDFVVDFGNPMLFFLMKQNKSLDKALRKGRIKLHDAYNSDGTLVAQGIYAQTASFCGREYHNVSIGVTDKMETFEQLGLLGLPFYSTPIVLDFDKKVMKVAVNEKM